MPNFLFHCFRSYGVESGHNVGGFSESIMVRAGAAAGATTGCISGSRVRGRRAVLITAMAVAADSREFSSSSACSFHLACSLLSVSARMHSL